MRVLICYLFTIVGSNFLEAPLGMIMPVSGIGLASPNAIAADWTGWCRP
jgi:hypothetical protein